jgi:phosphate transport system permease protein
MKNDRNVYTRILEDRLFTGLIVLLSFMSLLPLFLILYYIGRNGIAAINWGFFTSLPAPVGEPGGGISNALIGTGILIAVACILAVPVGIAAGVFLSEYGKSRLAYMVRLVVEVLQGIPSIVIGIIAYLWIVVPMRGFSALSGGAALAIMMLPVVIRSTEETLKLIPATLREASLALGVPYYKTVLRVILPAGLSGILTAILLSVARISGETAPLLFTAFGSPFMEWNVLKPMNSLPLLIFNYATSPYPDWHALAWGASLVLVVFVLLLNFVAKLVARRWKIQF